MKITQKVNESQFLMGELEFSPNFNPWRFDQELIELREKIDAKKKLY